MEGRTEDVAECKGSDTLRPDSTLDVRARKRTKVVGADGIDWSEQDRQWDCRINLADEHGTLEDARRELEVFQAIFLDWEKLKYGFIGGIELGENPSQEDYKRFHVHIAIILHTPNTRRAVVNALGLNKYLSGEKKGEPRSYYLAKRNPFSSFRGWKEHHTKEATKCTEAYMALEVGDPPREYANQLIERGKPMKMKQDDMLREIIALFQQGKKDKAFEEYPALTLRYHAQITAFVKTRVELPTEINHEQRLWLWGGPGTGKSAYIAWKYPKAFKKSLAKNEILYWNGLDLDWHTHVYLEDIGPEAFESLGMEQLKQWADPSHGYTVAMKYGAPIHGIRLPLIVTSNYQPHELMPRDQRHPLTELEAITRRFEVIHIDELLKREKLVLKSKEEIKELKRSKNADFSAVFRSLT